MAWTTPKTDFADGNVLTAAQMNAIGNDLQYLYDTGGQLISTTTLSGSGVTISIPNTYRNVRLMVRDFTPSANAWLGLRLNAAATDGTTYGFENGTAFTAGDTENQITTNTKFSSAGGGSQFFIDLFDYNRSVAVHYGTAQGIANGNVVFANMGMGVGSAAAITSVRIVAPTVADQAAPTATMTGTVLLIGY